MIRPIRLLGEKSSCEERSSIVSSSIYRHRISMGGNSVCGTLFPTFGHTLNICSHPILDIEGERNKTLFSFDSWPLKAFAKRSPLWKQLKKLLRFQAPYSDTNTLHLGSTLPFKKVCTQNRHELMTPHGKDQGPR